MAHHYRARPDDLAQLGKDLVRRSHAHCELCGKGGRALAPHEVPPLPPRPELEHTIMICGQCQDELACGELNPLYWRFLETVVWSDLPAVQVTAVRLVRRLNEQGESWATALLDTLYLEPAIGQWLDAP